MKTTLFLMIFLILCGPVWAATNCNNTISGSFRRDVCEADQLNRIEEKLDRIIEKRTIEQDRMMIGYINGIKNQNLPRKTK